MLKIVAVYKKPGRVFTGLKHFVSEKLRSASLSSSGSDSSVTKD